MFDHFSPIPRHRRYERTNVFNEAYVKQNIRGNGDDFAQECVRIHNHYRAQHGCPPLHLSTSICAISQEWANRLSKEDRFRHSNHPQYGENIFVIYMSNKTTSVVAAQQVVESWYSEHVFYPFDNHISYDTILKAGHFTQVIWSNSRELGIGKAVSKNNRLYVVANYYPAGNILRKFAENVPHKINNYTHLPHHYNKRLSSRRTDINVSTENLYVPGHHTASPQTETGTSKGAIQTPQHYVRRDSSRQPDTNSATETLHVPHHYSRRVSSRQLDISTETLNIPQYCNRRNSSKLLDTDDDDSKKTLHAPHAYSRRVSSRQFDTSVETLSVPQFYNRRNSSKLLTTDDNDSKKTLHAPHAYSRRVSSRELDTSAETLSVPQFYNRRHSSKLFTTDDDDSEETLHAPHSYSRRVSSRQLDTPAETLSVPQFYNRRPSS